MDSGGGIGDISIKKGGIDVCEDEIPPNAGKGPPFLLLYTVELGQIQVGRLDLPDLPLACCLCLRSIPSTI